MVKRILVVEDEPKLVATLRYNLARKGYQVVTATDGEPGLSAARTDRPDLIIVDLERIADRVTSICECVVYLVEGKSRS